MTILRSSAGMHVVSASSSAFVTAATAQVTATTQDSLVLTAVAGGTMSRSDAAPVTRRIDSGRQRTFRLRTAQALSVRAQPVVPDPAPRRHSHARTRHPVAAAEPAPETPPVKAKRLEKFSRSIQSIENYDLIRFIPVTIEPLGDSVFVADSPDLDLSVTGRTADEAVELLKEMIVRIYESSRSRKNTLDSARARQLKTLESFIGKSKGMWHWA